MNFEEYLAECMKNPEFRKEWKKRLEEYEKEKEQIKAELNIKKKK